MDFTFGLRFGVSGGALSRNILDFTGTQYADLTTSFVTTAAYSVEFEYSNVTTGSYQLDDVFSVVSDVLTGPASVTSILVDGVASTAAPSDGKIHTVKFIGSGVITVTQLATDGTDYFIGNFIKVTYTDSVTASNNQTYNFNSGSTTSETSEEGKTLTYYNVTAGDWEQYTWDEDNTGWVGPELVVNGTFDTASDWNLPPGVTISSGELHFTGGTSYVTQEDVYTPDKPILLGISVTSYTSGTVRIVGSGGTPPWSTATLSSVIIHAEIIDTIDSTIGRITILGSAFVGSIDNVSAKYILQPAT